MRNLPDRGSTEGLCGDFAYSSNVFLLSFSTPASCLGVMGCISRTGLILDLNIC